MEQATDNAPAALVKILKPLVGMRCDRAEIGLDRSVRLHLTTATPKPDVDPWEVQSKASAWRIMKSGSVLTGQYDCVDWERGIEAALSALRGLKLAKIEFSSTFPDAAFIFDGDVVVDLRSTSKQNVAWSARAPATPWVEVGPGQAWREISPDEPLEIQAAQREFMEYANAFGQRWRSRVAAHAGVDKCGRCAHWRGLTGGFYFWDFGVCANARSNMDGQLVGVKSGCDWFSVEINQRR